MAMQLVLGALLRVQGDCTHSQASQPRHQQTWPPQTHLPGLSPRLARLWVGPQFLPHWPPCTAGPVPAGASLLGQLSASTSPLILAQDRSHFPCQSTALSGMRNGLIWGCS